MAKKLFIIHGYSDGPSSFTSLKNFFISEAKYKRENIFLLDYASMDDQVRFKDFADKLDSEFEERFDGEQIDVACHSTGALVVRVWLALRRKRQRELGKDIDCPVKRIIFFAPANFGSDLAKLGQSFLGKFRSTFFNSNSHREDFMESGKYVLQGLEPASPFQWNLSHVDLYEEDYFSAKAPPDKRCYPFVFAAGNSYEGFQTRVVKQRKKPGTDGTVRICGTSLNTRKCTISFLGGEAFPVWTKEKKFKNIPFAVFNNFNHGSIIETGYGDEDSKEEGVRELFMNSETGPGPLVLESLKVDNIEKFNKMADKFSNYTQKFYDDETSVQEKYLPRFQQLFFKVRDDIGFDVEDYYIDFRVLDSSGDQHDFLTGRVDEELEAKIYTHSEDKSCRVMMFDFDKIRSLMNDIKREGVKLVFDIVATSHTSQIKYVKGHCVIFDGAKGKSKSKSSFLYPNTTTLVDVILNRIQGDKILSIS